MKTPQAINRFTLQRYPETSDRSLQAWNSSDEYIVKHVTENVSLNGHSKILIINDQFGALSCSFSDFSLTIWTDSLLSKTAIEKNINQNHLSVIPDFIEQSKTEFNFKHPYNLVIIRIPKHNSLLDFQLKTIQKYINQETILIAGGMTKEIHNSTISIFEKNIGTTKTSLARKKSRLIFAKHELPNLTNTQNDNFKTYHLKKNLITSYGLPGVFSRDKLDIGSSVLLEYLPEMKANQKLIDLGCGTGILGTIMAKANPTSKLTFCDESYLAVESAKKTFAENIGQDASFKVTDVLDGLEDSAYDHILCNPPFHQQNVQTLSIANKMFKQSAKKLKTTGELRVVANRHLKYRPMLENYFKNVKHLSNDSKFIVWLATNPRL